MSKELYTGILGEIQLEFNQYRADDSFNPENLEYYGQYLPDFEYIEFTGDDGYGENCHMIFMWKGKYYKMSGFIHKSHYGTDWYGDSGSVQEVKPKTIEVIKYV